MQISGSQKIAAPRQVVWDALHDAETLRQCLPGCETAEFKSENRLAIAVKVSFGIFSRVFKGRVKLSDKRPPEFYRMSGEGKGGTAGASKWTVDITLSEDTPDVTILDYAATAELDGKLAQLGGFVIEPVARKMATRVLLDLRQHVEARRMAG